jgi:hypothetical protein
VPDANTAVLTVFQGTVEAKVAGSTRRISAGQTLTLRRGGRPTDTTEAAERWQQRLRRKAGDGNSEF